MKQSHAYKGHASSYNVNILNLLVLNYSLQTVNLQLEVNQCDNVSYKKIESYDTTKYITFYSNSKAGTIISDSDRDKVFESIYTTIISNIQKHLGKGLGWIIDSAIDHTINISKYNPLDDSSFINLPKELDNPQKSLINNQNTHNNALNGFWLDTYILQIITQEVLEKLLNYMKTS